jgi:hypothetical protein
LHIEGHLALLALVVEEAHAPTLPVDVVEAGSNALGRPNAGVEQDRTRA